MTISIEINAPEQELQNYEQAGIDWKTQARKMVEERFFPDAPANSLTDTELQIKNPAFHAWRQEILQEHAAMSDEEKAAAAADDAELIRNLNAVRAENGERLL